MKRIKALLLAFASTLVAAELGCFLFGRLRSEAFTWYEPGLYALRPEDLTESLKQTFHPTLGWKTPHATPFGERPRPVDYPDALLATFGDSYTYCAGVADGETWQTHLARRLSADVYNFGNGAYGTDQALLRFREDFPAVRTPLVTLGLITENINRIHNRYRKFYFPHTGTPLTKPRFLLVDGELELLANPIRSADELVELCDPGFLEEIGEHDLWYNRNAYPRRTFPFCQFLFHRSFWLEVRHGRSGVRIDDVEPRPWSNLWADEEARALMFAILERFVAEARAQESRPILVLLPTHGEVATLVTGGVASDKVRAITDFARARGHDLFDGVAALAAVVADEDELAALYDHHLTARGNELLAELFHAWLEQHELLPGGR